MNKLKLACVASLLAAGIAQASTPCDGFDIKIKNKLADDLLVTKIHLNGADIQPGHIQKINGGTEQVFTVNSSSDAVMSGDFEFHTISLPSKVVKIQFNLKNSGLICEHTDTSPDSDYSVDKTRLPGKVDYSIFNK
ncbi:MAG TPA: hypothetical protein PK657_03960 [Legionella sp.]|nr:hypothetical protein [Legionella sp.]